MTDPQGVSEISAADDVIVAGPNAESDASSIQSSRRSKHVWTDERWLAPSSYDFIPQAQGKSMSIPPPEPIDITATKGQIKDDNQSIPQLSESEVREALLKHIKGKFGLGASAAKQCKITNITGVYSYQIVLDSLYEERRVEWDTCPFRIEKDLDNFKFVKDGEPPSAWSMDGNELAHHGVQGMEIPYTASVVACDNCSGTGAVICHACQGLKQIPCLVCKGSGTARKERCDNCNAGSVVCQVCQGTSMSDCPKCMGAKQLKQYLKVVQRLNPRETIVYSRNVKQIRKYFEKGMARNFLSETSSHIDPELDINDNSLVMLYRDALERHHEIPEDHRLMTETIDVFYTTVHDFIGQMSNIEDNFTGTLYGDERHVILQNYKSKGMGLDCCTLS